MVIDSEEGIEIDITATEFGTWVNLGDTGFQLMVKAEDLLGILHIRRKLMDE